MDIRQLIHPFDQAPSWQPRARRPALHVQTDGTRRGFSDPELPTQASVASTASLPTAAPSPGALAPAGPPLWPVLPERIQRPRSAPPVEPPVPDRPRRRYAVADNAEVRETLRRAGFTLPQLRLVAPRHATGSAKESQMWLYSHHAALLDVGFNRAQLVDIARRANRSARGFLARYAATLRDMGFTADELTAVVGWSGATVSVPALAQEGQLVLDRGYTPADLLRMAARPRGGEIIKDFVSVSWPPQVLSRDLLEKILDDYLAAQ